jgi:hypothetical protein
MIEAMEFEADIGAGCKPTNSFTVERLRLSHTWLVLPITAQALTLAAYHVLRADAVPYLEQSFHILNNYTTHSLSCQGAHSIFVKTGT